MIKISSKKVVFQRGFEPPTPALGGRCSIQLSYWNKKLGRPPHGGPSMEWSQGVSPRILAGFLRGLVQLSGFAYAHLRYENTYVFSPMVLGLSTKYRRAIGSRTFNKSLRLIFNLVSFIWGPRLSRTSCKLSKIISQVFLSCNQNFKQEVCWIL